MRIRRHLGLTAVLGAVLFAAIRPAAVSAQTAAAAFTPPTTKAEVLWTSLAAGTLGVISWGANRLTAPSCQWCDRDASGHDTLNGFDRAIRNSLVAGGEGANRANTISDVTLVTTWVLPPVLLATSEYPGRSGHDRLEGVRMVVWAMTVNVAVTSGMKRSIARERPYVHFQNAEVQSTSEPNASFPSGHTSSTFTPVFAAARACRLTRCGNERRIWLIGVPLASVTGTLRIVADKHYATDVLAGAGIGAAIGWFTPQLYRTFSNGAQRAAVRPLAGWSAWGVEGTWAW